MGCDGILGLKKVLDRCGICGGSNLCMFWLILKFMWLFLGYGECLLICGVGNLFFYVFFSFGFKGVGWK